MILLMYSALIIRYLRLFKAFGLVVFPVAIFCFCRRRTFLCKTKSRHLDKAINLFTRIFSNYYSKLVPKDVVGYPKKNVTIYMD